MQYSAVVPQYGVAAFPPVFKDKFRLRDVRCEVVEEGAALTHVHAFNAVSLQWVEIEAFTLAYGLLENHWMHYVGCDCADVLHIAHNATISAIMSSVGWWRSTP